MDPNALLARIRAFTKKYEQAFDPEWDEIVDFATDVTALDEWLSKAGALPEAWQKDRAK